MNDSSDGNLSDLARMKADAEAGLGTAVVSVVAGIGHTRDRIVSTFANPSIYPAIGFTIEIGLILGCLIGRGSLCPCGPRN